MQAEHPPADILPRNKVIDQQDYQDHWQVCRAVPDSE